jgi:hypothetical protein
MIMEEIQREITYGEQACGVDFNPDARIDVNDLKMAFAAIVDVLNARRSTSESSEVKRLLSIAITEAQTAQMWAIKAITYKY